MNNKRRDLLKKMTVSQQFVTQAEDNAKMDKVRRYAPLILLVIMTAIGGISQKNFFSWANIVNITAIFKFFDAINLDKLLKIGIWVILGLAVVGSVAASVAFT